MRSAKITLIALMVAVFVSMGFTQTVWAARSEFRIINKSDDDVTVVLEGTKTYRITVEAGEKFSKDIDEDTYMVTYTHCGIDFDWKLKHNEDYKLVIYPCRNQPTKMQVKSHLSEDIVLEINGYESLDFDISLGKTRIELFSGDITYEYTACDGQFFSGEMFVEKRGTSQLVLHSCEWFQDPQRIYGKPNPVKFRIVNHASFPIIMTLIGPENYLVTVNPGVNVFTLISGNYSYSYFVDAKLNNGSMLVTQTGAGILIVSPSYVFDYVDESDDLQ